MAPPRKRQTQKRSNSAKRLQLAKADGADVEWVIPPPPQGVVLREETLELWTAIWQEPQAKGFTRGDRAVLERYILAYDEWIGALAAVSAEPTVTGSMGQVVAHPLMSWVQSREAVMERCEKQLGLGLRNRADLGISTATAKLTAEQVNKMTREGRSGGSGSTPQGKSGGAEEEVLEGFVIEK